MIFGIQQWILMVGLLGIEIVRFSDITAQLNNGLIGQQEAIIFHRDLAFQWKFVMT